MESKKASVTLLIVFLLTCSFCVCNNFYLPKVSHASEKFDTNAKKYKPHKKDNFRNFTKTVNNIMGKNHAAVKVVDMKTDEVLYELNPNKQWVAASTYKVFVAYSILRQMQLKKIKWSSPFMGRNFRWCFNEMITHSNNECARGWISRKYSLLYNDMYRRLKLSNKTGVGIRGAFRTTVNDQFKVWNGYYKGTLLTKKLRNDWWYYTKTHLFRNGIMKGIGGDGECATKVGWLYPWQGYGSIKNEVGICFTKKGNYFIAIYTKNASQNYNQTNVLISRLTRKIYNKIVR